MEYFKQQLEKLGWSDDFKVILKNNHIHYKEDESSDLVILFNNYNDLFYSKLNNVVRSVVISKDKKKVINYSCQTPIENQDGIGYIMKNTKESPFITECYEGTFMSLFNYEGKWYLSTRRCLDAKESIWNGNNLNDLFMDVLEQDGYKSFDEFTEKLDDKLNYYFVLLHHKNIHLVDYSYLYGKDYKKLVFVFTRDSLLNTTYTKGDESIITENIIMPKLVDDISYLDTYNELNQWEIPPKSEGIILHYKDNTLVKLQSLDYQFAKVIGSDENIYLGMLKMYQLDKLTKYLSESKNVEKFEKITNPYNTKETYHSLGIINSTFRTLTTELYNLYKMLYDNSGKPIDNDFYKVIPSEYRYFMFKIRGINFKKLNGTNTLTEKDIYFLLKNVDISNISDLLRMRKLMNNMAYSNSNKFDDNMKKFRMISNNVDKLNLKLVNILTSKLYPEIMDSDLPNVAENQNVSI